MLRGKIRFCDVCNAEIPKGTKYSRQAISSHDAKKLNNSPEIGLSYTV